jgi:hypothetical protein
VEHLDGLFGGVIPEQREEKSRDVQDKKENWQS